MTGVGVAHGETELGDLAIEVRSVNGRNLSIKTRLPAVAQGFEADFEQRLRKGLERGSVRVAVEVVATSTSAESIVDQDRAALAAAELTELAAKLGLAQGPTLAEVLAVPGVLASAPTTRVAKEPPAGVAALFDQAVAKLLEHRRAEGRSIADLMIGHIEQIDAGRAIATSRAPEIIAAHRDKLLERVNQFLEGQARTMDDADVLREVALFAERADVTEELDRLAVHLDQARTLLARGGQVGRKLEFLLQEVLREINTLGSKSPDAAMAQTVVDMKVAIDRAREQAANLE